MPKTPRSSARSRSSAVVLTDADWLTVIAALLNDSTPESRELAKRLLAHSKPGRQIRLARLIRDRQPTLGEMARRLNVSRRTVFRYLSGLEEQGVRLELNERNGYRVKEIPKRFKRLL